MTDAYCMTTGLNGPRVDVAFVWKAKYDYGVIFTRSGQLDSFRRWNAENRLVEAKESFAVDKENRIIACARPTA